MFKILKASPEHAQILSDLGKKTFAETFVGKSYYTQEIIDGYSVHAFAPEAIRKDLANQNSCYFLLQVEGEFAGYAKVTEREGVACLNGKHAIYLERIYLAKEFQRRGLGGKLFAAVLEEGRARGYSWMWLSVWEFNKPAVAFYEQNGFQKAGEWEWPFESNGVRYVDIDWIFVGPI